MKNKKVVLMLTCLAFIISGCSVSGDKIDDTFAAGRFTKAEKMIRQKIAEGKCTLLEKIELENKIDIMNRIRRDFSKDADDILPEIKKYYPDLTPAQLKKWEKTKALEYMIIDGKKKYFAAAAKNLFRIDKEAKKRKNEIDGDKKDSLSSFLEKNLPEVVETIDGRPGHLGDAVDMKFKYTLTVDADAVPAGEIVRCWLPFPREGHRRQKNIELISTSCDNYVLAPNSVEQRTLYMQKPAVKGKPTVFEMEFSLTTRPQWHDLENIELPSVDKDSEIYRKYTAERYPHILFTDKVRKLSKEIVGDEKDTKKILKAIFKYIHDNYPWASAREYSTIENIPEYVIDNNHGDCGQVTLLFMTLARLNGIPARWQSGWMLHPGNLNLHDWCQIYFPKIGWIPVDQSFGLTKSEKENVHWFYLGGIDAYRLIVNDDYARPLFPAKNFLRSETNDFQRGEVEWRGGNLYFDQWDYHMDVKYLNK